MYSMQCACVILLLCPVRLYSIFAHYLLSGTIFEEKKILNVKCVF